MIPILIALGIIGLYTISMYNSLIRYKNEVLNAFGGMDAQLKKRHDLIPNLVASVKAYLKHERELLSSITELRERARKRELSTDDKVHIDNEITEKMQSLMVAVENYPDLKASENFLKLQDAMHEVEKQISAARRAYNAAVTNYNYSIESFPRNILARMMEYKQKEVFVIPDTQRQGFNLDELFDN